MRWKWFFLCLLVAGAAVLWQSDAARRELMREVGEARSLVNELAKSWEPWQVIFLSVGGTLVARAVLSCLLREDQSLVKRVKRSFFSVMRKVPFVRKYVEKQMDGIRKVMEDALFTPSAGETFRHELPVKGHTHSEVMSLIAEMNKKNDVDWSKGWVSGTVYNGSEALTLLNTEVYSKFTWSNPLHADVFPVVRKMEAEVVKWCTKIFNGGQNSCGTMTAGGTESILMAMRAYRQIGYSKGIRYPEIVCPISAHAAFDKAAGYFCMKLVHVPVDPVTRMVDLRAMARAISSNTVVLVGSAPQFPHGIIDPIQEIAKLAVKNRVGLHVDCCLGGFILPFMERAGYPVEPFDFRVKGVTSISADTHKYGFAPKGTSVVMYSSHDLRHNQYFVSPDWQGGMYASPTIAGSRSGAVIAATWATMMSIGLEGYVDSTRKIVAATLKLKAGVRSIPGVYVLGDPQCCVVAFGSRDFDIYRLSDAMTTKGWHLNALQFPSSVHLALTLIHTKEGVVERFLADMAECVAKIMRDPKAKTTGVGALYGMSQSIPDRRLVEDVAFMYLDLCYQVDTAKDSTATGTSS